MNDLVWDKLKEIVHMQDVIRKHELHYKAKCREIYSFNECSLHIVFLRDIHEEHLSLADADDKERYLAVKSNNLGKCKITIEKNEHLVTNVNDGLIDLKNIIIIKEVPENENPNKIVHIVENFFNVNKQYFFPIVFFKRDIYY